MKHIKYEAGENPNPGPCVTVICDDAAHPDKVAHLAFFYKNPGDAYWGVLPAKSVKGGSRWALQMLDGTTVIPYEQWAELEGKPARKRFDLRCELCGDSLPVKLETLCPVLDTLARHADAWEIELTALRARLVK